MSARNRKRTRLEEESDDEYEASSSVPSQRIKTLDPVMMQDWDAEEIERNVKCICRYAMSCEYKKKIIRREDLNKLLSDGCKRMLPSVLDKARSRLRNIFGFEIIELPSMKEKTNQSQTQRAASTQQTQQTGQDTQQVPPFQTAKKSTGPSSGNFILRSILKEEYRTPEIIERSTKEYQLTGILYVILGLIFISGQSMTSADLNGHLNRLNVKKSIIGVEDINTREALMSEFMKDNYIKRSKMPDADTEEPQFIYTWGPRAMVEVGHAGIAAFLLSFFGDDMEPEQRADLENKMWKQSG